MAVLKYILLIVAGLTTIVSSYFRKLTVDDPKRPGVLRRTQTGKVLLVITLMSLALGIALQVHGDINARQQQEASEKRIQDLLLKQNMEDNRLVMRISVARVANIDYSDADAGHALFMASAYLSRCGVSLKLRDHVEVMPADMPADVDSIQDIERLKAYPSLVEVVRGVYVCGANKNLGPGLFLACTDEEVNRVLITPKVTERVSGVVIAHQIGHLAGLGHSSDRSSLMNAVTGKTSPDEFPTISGAECEKIHKFAAEYR